MTRYSASRGILYSAPPAAASRDAEEQEVETDVETDPTPADD